MSANRIKPQGRAGRRQAAQKIRQKTYKTWSYDRSEAGLPSLPPPAASGYARRTSAGKPSLNLKHPGIPCRSSRISSRRAPGSGATARCAPSTCCFPDLMGIPRGKRVTVEELEGVHRNGLLLPASMFALDVLGGTVQATGLGFDEGDADRVCLPLPGSLAARALARRPRRADAGRDVRARPHAVLRRSAPRARAGARALRPARPAGR